MLLADRAVVNEVQDLFMTWRNPSLLFDYLRIHNGGSGGNWVGKSDTYRSYTRYVLTLTLTLLCDSDKFF